jgi:hypothetical protein
MKCQEPNCRKKTKLIELREARYRGFDIWYETHCPIHLTRERHEAQYQKALDDYNKRVEARKKMIKERADANIMPELLYNEHGRLIAYPCVIKGCPNQILKDNYGYFGAYVGIEECLECSSYGWRM